MRRWHQDVSVSRWHQRDHLKVVHDWPRRPVDCACELQVGRFRKIGGHGCGKVRCLLCRFDKIFQVPSHKERIARLRYLEQLREIGW